MTDRVSIESDTCLVDVGTRHDILSKLSKAIIGII